MALDIPWLQTKFPELGPLALLGQGGQKWVFAAQHPEHGSIVLKIVHPKQGLDLVEREIAAVRSIGSSRVPRIISSGQIDTSLGPCYWIHEARVLGSPLSDVIRSGRLPWEEVLRLGLHILQALTDAERAQIVHRDVKPGNIMKGDDGAFWLLDFGLARHLDLSSLTPTAAMFGKFTPGYAPPEQFRNIKREIDSRADLFALGVTLYEAATGINPYHDRARDILEVLRRVERNTLPRVPQLAFANYERFADFVACLSQRRRGHRPRTAAAALEWYSDLCSDTHIS